ncbi:MAG: hypothetical protein KBC26_01995 [Candidatus Pacebacteria bacterium]|nr:hypothetical protein [Candidatus Paceibacterota bacterium]
MDQNQNNYQQNNQTNIPPSPPSPEEQVGVRTMASDVQSVQQSGGEMPQSQVINAPELSTTNQATNIYQQPQQSTPPQESTPAPQVVQEETTPSSGIAKKIGWTIGIVILLGALGFGAYYLVTALNQPVPVVTPEGELPLATIQPTPEITQTPEPTPEQVIHNSVISNPTKTEPLILSDISLVGIKSALAVAAQDKMVVGSVKEMPVVDAAQKPIEAAVIAQMLLPTFAQNASQYIQKDATMWLYADKVGGNKVGVVFKLQPAVVISQVTSTIGMLIESGQESKNLFLSDVKLPTGAAFKDGLIEGFPVRYIAYNTKLGQVFEYGFVETTTGKYIVLATSYNQMVDVIRRLKTSMGQTTPTPPATSTPQATNVPQGTPATPTNP